MSAERGYRRQAACICAFRDCAGIGCSGVQMARRWNRWRRNRNKSIAGPNCCRQRKLGANSLISRPNCTTRANLEVI